jgi:hypothetical protein
MGLKKTLLISFTVKWKAMNVKNDYGIYFEQNFPYLNSMDFQLFGYPTHVNNHLC